MHAVYKSLMLRSNITCGGADGSYRARTLPTVFEGKHVTATYTYTDTLIYVWYIDTRSRDDKDW